MNSKNKQKTQTNSKKKLSLSDLEYFDLQTYNNSKSGIHSFIVF
jgi:hypothetical protein